MFFPSSCAFSFSSYAFSFFLCIYFPLLLTVSEDIESLRGDFGDLGDDGGTEEVEAAGYSNETTAPERKYFSNALSFLVMFTCC